MEDKFDYDNLRLQVEVADCRDAIQKAADVLIEKGCITSGYVDEMNAAFDELGPYFVLSPGMAFAHSKPSPSVKRTGLSLITLKNPVNFGSAANDPVFLVCVIASVDAKEHIDQLRRIAQFLGDERHVSALRAARTDEDAHAIVDELNKGGC
ncbi:PTS sugar transporter subunit IIA [Olsenella sp. An285]|uniref:PTS sugar transporter subunit IIA n=1 Tax=Olsenella sp. An285 TaxID=1965621 RepID=UPI001302932D|nr:PTS sugar transporter subunit IIA [Olsenella sp. An285]